MAMLGSRGCCESDPVPANMDASVSTEITKFTVMLASRKHARLQSCSTLLFAPSDVFAVLVAALAGEGKLHEDFPKVSSILLYFCCCLFCLLFTKN